MFPDAFVDRSIFAPVPFMVRPVNVPTPDDVMFPVLSEVEKRFVDEAVVLNIVVVVALVEVEFRNVTFWRVEEPRARILEAIRIPVEVMFPVLSEVENKFVDEAVVEKIVVVVALVEVEFKKVTFCRVDELVTNRFPVVVRPVIDTELAVSNPFPSIVSAATVEVAKVLGDDVAK
jgi:hypothetical protein